MAQAYSESYEHVVEKKLEGSFLARRVLMIALYVIYVLAFFIIGTITRLGVPMLALIPITLWILIWLTWPYCKIEYEYALIDGNLTFSVIYGGRRRREQFSIRIASAERVAPIGEKYDSEVVEFEPSRVYNGLSSGRDPKDAYFLLFENESEEGCVFYFEATARMLRILKYYNSSTVVTDVSV